MFACTREAVAGHMSELAGSRLLCDPHASMSIDERDLSNRSVGVGSHERLERLRALRARHQAQSERAMGALGEGLHVATAPTPASAHETTLRPRTSATARRPRGSQPVSGSRATE